MVLGKTMNSHKTFMERLTISQKLREVKSVNNSDVIIAFVPVVSRAGTDIGAAMGKIPRKYKQLSLPVFTVKKINQL